MIGAVAGVLLALGVVAATTHYAWRWPTLAAFTTSAGFGGLMALGAGVLAYLAARRTATTSKINADEDRRQRERIDRKEQWWKRAHWAMDLALNERQEVAEVGYEVLAALADSEWAEEHEGDVIAAVTDRVLGMVETGPQDDADTAGDGDAEDGDAEDGDAEDGDAEDRDAEDGGAVVGGAGDPMQDPVQDSTPARWRRTMSAIRSRILRRGE